MMIFIRFQTSSLSVETTKINVASHYTIVGSKVTKNTLTPPNLLLILCLVHYCDNLSKFIRCSNVIPLHAF